MSSRVVTHSLQVVKIIKIDCDPTSESLNIIVRSSNNCLMAQGSPIKRCSGCVRVSRLIPHHGMATHATFFSFHCISINCILRKRTLVMMNEFYIPLITWVKGLRCTVGNRKSKRFLPLFAIQSLTYDLFSHG